MTKREHRDKHLLHCHDMRLAPFIWTFKSVTIEHAKCESVVIEARTFEPWTD